MTVVFHLGPSNFTRSLNLTPFSVPFHGQNMEKCNRQIKKTVYFRIREAFAFRDHMIMPDDLSAISVHFRSYRPLFLLRAQQNYSISLVLSDEILIEK